MLFDRKDGSNDECFLFSVVFWISWFSLLCTALNAWHDPWNKTMIPWNLEIGAHKIQCLSRKILNTHVINVLCLWAPGSILIFRFAPCFIINALAGILWAMNWVCISSDSSRLLWRQRLFCKTRLGRSHCPSLSGNTEYSRANEY